MTIRPATWRRRRSSRSHVDTLAGTLRYVKSKQRSKHDVYLSWDEWNVWYKNHEMDGHWTQAPHLIEEVYNLEDALVVAQWLNVFLRKCDVLKIACLAQIVNVIAPILTTTDGLVKQTIFYPFMLVSKFARGQSLAVATKAPLVSTRQFGDMPALDVSASHDPSHRPERGVRRQPQPDRRSVHGHHLAERSPTPDRRRVPDRGLGRQGGQHLRTSRHDRPPPDHGRPDGRQQAIPATAAPVVHRGQRCASYPSSFCSGKVERRPGGASL